MGDFLVDSDSIIDKRELTLRNQVVGQVNVQWKHLSPEEATWEMEGNMREAYSSLFQNGIDEN